ncbi:conserved exported hypothetical protein [Rubrivivax sp. A210]|uniref:DUF3106 domain-containing protein n=1 Tax=Rubrivivax sp. A210 TaxID=2772301 RepID=UPI0019C3A1DF|nr:DUF3106 domain-containing protein [Rubrivivax sp. A210]CAD5374719.1 conserved exported hypothetical protein [Rubrivivax sp. A210]
MTRAGTLRLLARALPALLAAVVTVAMAADPAGGPAWTALTPAQKQVLAPLQQDWAGIDAQRKSKWLEVAARFPSMPAAERERVQQRMSEWARMSPNQRAQARLQFQEAQQIPAYERQAKWEAYQALSPDERKSLAARTKPAVSAPTTQPAALVTNSKRNVAPMATGAQVKPVSPTVVQAKPGATTTSMTARADPPPHHQPGMPKIAATPGFVDRATLLPKRGPQGAAVRTPPPSAPASRP